MFPDVEPDTLLAVLQSCGGNVEAAVETLLGVTSERVLAEQRSQPSSVNSLESSLPHGALQAAQIAQDEEIARQLQEQLLMEQHEPGARHPSYASLSGRYPGQLHGAHPGTVAPYAGEAGYHPSVHRPPSWGVAAPAPAPTSSDEGYGISSSLYSAGSAMASSVGSWWEWATSEPSSKKDEELEAEASRRGEAREMQTIRRGPRRDFCGPSAIATVAGDEGTQDEQALCARACSLPSRLHTRTHPSRPRHLTDGLPHGTLCPGLPPSVVTPAVRAESRLWPALAGCR